MPSRTGNAGPFDPELGVRVDLHEMMADYDALPRAVRQRIANASVDFATGSILKLHRDGCPVSVIIHVIDESEQEILARREVWP